MELLVTLFLIWFIYNLIVEGAGNFVDKSHMREIAIKENWISYHSNGIEYHTKTGRRCYCTLGVGEDHVDCIDYRTGELLERRMKDDWK